MSGSGRPAPALLVVVGPTGSGKSALALDLAQSLGGEIVGCDALQVYRDLDAATAKPSAVDRRRVPHHLIDCADPRRDFTLAQYVRLAETAIAEIHARGRVPFVVGGTGMYLRGLLRGVLPAPPRDPELRRRLRAIAERGGGRRLRSLLERSDPSSARRIGSGDLQRTIRAIELARTPGGNWSERLEREGTWSEERERYPSLKIGLETDRAELDRRLDARVESFFAAGLVTEVRGLLDRGVPGSANAFKAIGYREVLAALTLGRDPETVKEQIKSKTRRFARRQRTWFRGEPGVLWVDARENRSDLVERIGALWRERHPG